MKVSDKINGEVFRDIALMGPATFLGRLVPKTKLSEYKQFTRENSKIFLLLNLISEVQKAGFAMDSDINSSGDKVEPINENIIAQRYNTLLDEQSMWIRKLLEILILLINFTSTNNSLFYYHFLLLHELRHFNKINSDNIKFFNCRNAITYNTIESIKNNIAYIEDKLGNLSICWYTKSSKSGHNKRNYQIVPMQTQLENALKLSSAREKIALGMTYNQFYGDTSVNIHLSTLRKNYINKKERFNIGLYQCGLLSVAILKRAHELTDIQPTGINSFINNIDNNSSFYNNLVLQNFKVGDLVLCDGPYLGEIKEISISKYGYENYRVKYLVESPIKDIKETWFPSIYLHLYINKSDVIDKIRKKLKELKIEHSDRIPAFTDLQIEKVAYDAMIKVWEIGIGEYMKKTMIPMRFGDNGLGYNLENSL